MSTNADDAMSPRDHAELQLLSMIDAQLARKWPFQLLSEYLDAATEEDAVRALDFGSFGITVDIYTDAPVRSRLRSASRSLALLPKYSTHVYAQVLLWEIEFLARPDVTDQLRRLLPASWHAARDQSRALSALGRNL